MKSPVIFKKWLNRTSSFLSDLEKENPNEPFYDPVHIGGAVVVTLAALGCLYWLLWTLLVYEGGIFLKIKALRQVTLGGKTLGDLGYEGYPYAMGAFEGWIGNLIALILCIAVVIALHRLYVRNREKAKN